MKDNIFTKEVKGENVLLLILSIVAIILGILLFAGILTVYLLRYLNLLMEKKRIINFSFLID